MRAEPTQTGIGVGDHRGDRLVDFVRDGSRHLSQQHYPIETREIGLGLLQGLLRTFAIGDVYVNRLQKGISGFGWRYQGRCDVQPHRAAVSF